MAFPKLRILRDDPARQKSRYVTGAGSGDYASRVSRFNKELYRPTDTKPLPPTLPTFLPPALSPSSAGTQITSRAETDAIAARYGGGSYATAANSTFQPPPSLAPIGSYDTPPAPMPIVAPAAETAPRASMPQGATEGAAPAQNARQRWLEEGGSNRTFNRANVAAGIRPKIDGRATQSPRNYIKPVEFKKPDGSESSMGLPY